MSANHSNVLLRDHTILGVCEAIGEDLGFPPVLLRIAFAAALYWNPIAVIGTYLGLGLIVAISRVAVPESVWAWPLRRKAAAGDLEASPEPVDDEAEQPQALAA